VLFNPFGIVEKLVANIPRGFHGAPGKYHSSRLGNYVVEHAAWVEQQKLDRALLLTRATYDSARLGMADQHLNEREHRQDGVHTDACFEYGWLCNRLLRNGNWR
jgi:hypothetical protein